MTVHPDREGTPGNTRLAGKVAVVSGASSGNGRAIAHRLAAEGASVICGDLQRAPRTGGLDGDEATDAQIVAGGGQAEFAAWDITSPEQTLAALELALDRYGRLDVIVANAGIGPISPPLPDEPLELWRLHLDVNLTGTWHTVRLGLKKLIEQGEGGSIVTLSSVAGLVGIAGEASAYGVTKAGIIQLTRQAAIDAAPFGITVNAVCPGFVRTALTRDAWSDPEALSRFMAQHPLGRLGEPEDIAAAVAFLASPDAAWITGVALPVDGGLTCA